MSALGKEQQGHGAEKATHPELSMGGSCALACARGGSTAAVGVTSTPHPAPRTARAARLDACAHGGSIPLILPVIATPLLVYGRRAFFSELHRKRYEISSFQRGLTARRAGLAYT